jgi:hypothetical protein
MEQHMRLPIDTVAVRFVTAGPAEPVLDYESRAQKVDESGQSLFSVHLFAVAPGSRDSITVKVAGEPKGLGEFTPVKVTNLMATTWETGDRHGVSFRADKIEASKTATL